MVTKVVKGRTYCWAEMVNNRNESTPANDTEMDSRMPWKLGPPLGQSGCDRLSSVDDGEDVLLGQQDVLVGAELDVGASVFAVEHLVANADFRGLT